MLCLLVAASQAFERSGEEQAGVFLALATIKFNFLLPLLAVLFLPPLAIWPAWSWRACRSWPHPSG
jgi:hypothetical protein